MRSHTPYWCIGPDCTPYIVGKYVNNRAVSGARRFPILIYILVQIMLYDETSVGWERYMQINQYIRRVLSLFDVRLLVIETENWTLFGRLAEDGWVGKIVV